MGAPEPGVVLDASAIIAFLRDEPAAPRVAELLRGERTRMSTVSAAETVDVLVRRYGWATDDVVAAVEQLHVAGVEAVTPSLDIATRAGELRAQLFDRRTRRISLADCFVLATAELGDRVATGDKLLAAAARNAGCAVVALR